ncbi:MAG: Spy/CpxP family protein refolding chaperone [Acidobacteria bacterium]|nr:Spy/CpxP family protein refolding chaperone [Acidobacteriota bacterium]
MVLKVGRTRTLIGICAVAALVALVAAGVVVAQVQRPGPMGGLMGDPGMRGMGQMGRGQGSMGRRQGPMGRGMGPMMGGRGPMERGLMLGQLDLTEAQRDAIKKIQESHRSEIQAIAEQEIPARRAVMDATETGDETAIREASGKLGALMTEGAVLRGKIHTEIFGVLTPEQKEKAKKFRADAEQRMDQFRGPRKQKPLF